MKVKEKEIIARICKMPEKELTLLVGLNGFGFEIGEINQRALDNTQIAMVELKREGEELSKKPEGNLREPQIELTAKSQFPVEYLLEILKILDKSGVSHVFFSMGNKVPLKMEAKLQENVTTKPINIKFWLAPRIED